MGIFSGLSRLFGARTEETQKGASLSQKQMDVLRSQWRRASTLQNCLLIGIFSNQRGGAPTSNSASSEDMIIAAAANHILAMSIDEQVENLKGMGIDDAKEKVHSRAIRILKQDPDLERLVFRTLYDVVSLGEMLGIRDKVIQRHPRIIEVVLEGRDSFPDLIADVEEVEFKKLSGLFADKYMHDEPDSKANMLSLFL